jgi:uncharacterized SAM-binding protein YcdF (DUF218 family)
MTQIKTEEPVSGVKKLARKWGRFPLIALALIVAAIILGFILTALGAILIVSDPIEKKADAVVALSGGDDRLVEAARLYQNKQADLIILTETGEVLPKFGKYSEIKRFDAILTLGIPSGAIMVTEKTVNNTEDEAHVVRKLIQPMNLKSLIVVTDPYHTLRTRMIFDNEFRNTNISIMVHPIPGHWYKSTTWWTSSAGWQATFGEYIRIFYYLVRYRL